MKRSIFFKSIRVSFKRAHRLAMNFLGFGENEPETRAFAAVDRLIDAKLDKEAGRELTTLQNFWDNQIRQSRSTRHDTVRNRQIAKLLVLEEEDGAGKKSQLYLVEVGREKDTSSKQQFKSTLRLTQLSLDRYLNRVADVYEEYSKERKRNNGYFASSRLKNMYRIYLDLAEILDEPSYKELLRRLFGRVSNEKVTKQKMRRQYMQEDSLSYSTLPNLREQLKDGRSGTTCLVDALSGHVQNVQLDDSGLHLHYRRIADKGGWEDRIRTYKLRGLLHGTSCPGSVVRAASYKFVSADSFELPLGKDIRFVDRRIKGKDPSQEVVSIIPLSGEDSLMSLAPDEIAIRHENGTVRASWHR